MDPSRYLIELAHAVRRADGAAYLLRPIRPDDATRLEAFHRRLSPLTTYRRFFNVHPELCPEEVEHFTCVDFHDRLALILECSGEIVAVCRYERTAETTDAEVAFVVADEFQHRGIGGTLLEELAAVAWQRGITTFIATTLAEDRSMLDVFHHSGFPVTSQRDHETVTLRFSIRPQDREAATARRTRVAATTSRPGC